MKTKAYILKRGNSASMTASGVVFNEILDCLVHLSKQIEEIGNIIEEMEKEHRPEWYDQDD